MNKAIICFALLTFACCCHNKNKCNDVNDVNNKTENKEERLIILGLDTLTFEDYKNIAAKYGFEVVPDSTTTGGMDIPSKDSLIKLLENLNSSLPAGSVP